MTDSVPADNVAEPPLIPEASATLSEYLKIDWIGLESGMEQFLGALEDFSSTAFAVHKEQPYAMVLGISLMVIATLILERARQHNRTPALECDVVGLLNARSSSRRSRGQGRSDFVP